MLRTALKDLRRQAHVQQQDSNERLFAFSHEIFAHIGEYRKVFQMMVGKRSGTLVQQLLQKIVVDLVREDIKTLVRRRENRWEPTEAVVQYVTGGFSACRCCGLPENLPVPVDEVNALFSPPRNVWGESNSALRRGWLGTAQGVQSRWHRMCFTVPVRGMTAWLLSKKQQSLLVSECFNRV